MKKLILIKGVIFALLFITLSLNISFDRSYDYCDGWEEGYIEGYCYLIINCVEPVVPVCPVPLVGQERQQDGFNRGFEAGKKAKR